MLSQQTTRRHIPENDTLQKLYSSINCIQCCVDGTITSNTKQINAFYGQHAEFLMLKQVVHVVRNVP
jgi:hypothetical protein